MTTGSHPIVDLSVPELKTPAWIDQQKAPLLIGQLKAIAAPFYTRLHAADPAWLEAERLTNGTNHADSIFPWTPETSDDTNKAVATIGQLKAVFSLRFATLDADSDGLTNMQETALGTNPSDPDIDHDGFTDVEEIANGTDPHVSDAFNDEPTAPQPMMMSLSANAAVNPSVLINGDFSSPSITSNTNWQTWSSVAGWKAVVGNKIEYQKISPYSPNNAYCELKADPAGHYGIQQTIRTTPGKTYILALDCKARSGNNLKVSDSDFKLCVGNGTSPTNSLLNRNVSFSNYNWTKVSATFTATGTYSTISLVPTNLSNKTFGCFVDNVSLGPVDIEEVISDQIAGNDANKLPTAYYGEQPNNPMLMGTRTGNDARLVVKVIFPRTAAGKIFVGARLTEASSHESDPLKRPILNSVLAANSPAKTNLSFSALSGSKAYEIVAGYDTNGNSSLDPNEVSCVFEKTPRTNPGDKPYSPPPGKTGDPSFKWLDRIVVVTQDDWTSARTTTDGYGNGVMGVTHPEAAKLIQAFARGVNTVAGASPTEFGVTLDASIIPSPEGLSHPVGAKWDMTKQAKTHRLVFPDASALSDLVEDSNGLKQMWGRVLWKNRAALAAAATGTWGAITIHVTDNDIDFADSDNLKQVHVALGKCQFEGDLQVSLKAKSGGGFDVGALKYSGSIFDLYDFAYGADKILGGLVDPKNAARTQAGLATLTSAVHPDGGRVFYTRVKVDHNWFNYIGTYP